MWQRFRVSSIALVVAFSLSVSAVAMSLAPVALAAPPKITIVTSCSELALQNAIGQATPGIPLIVQYRETACDLTLASPLVLPAGANITIDGGGLVLVGTSTSTDVFDVGNDTGTSSLNLSDVTIKQGQIGVSLAVDEPGSNNSGRLTCSLAVNQQGSNASGHLTGCFTSDHGGNGVPLICSFAVNQQGNNVSGRLIVCFGMNPAGFGAVCMAVDHAGGNGVQLTCFMAVDHAGGNGVRLTCVGSRG